VLRTLLGLTNPDAEEMLGGIDPLKLRSSLMLFARADPQ